MRKVGDMKYGSTLLLRLAVLVMGLMVLALCIIALPTGIESDETGYYRPILIGMYLTTIPFYIAMFQTLKLLNYVDKNTAFSEKSVKALKYIKYCAGSISVVYGASLPYFYYAAQQDDAPGVVVIGMLFTFAPLVIAVFAAVLQILLRNAIAIKSENDLTV